MAEGERPRRLKFALDTNVIIGAFERHDAGCRALLESGRDGHVALSVSRTLDQELRGTVFTDDPLWPYVTTMGRLPRPSAALGRFRLGEASLGYGGLGGTLTRGKSPRHFGRNQRDTEHLEGADIWKADGFVTDDIALLKRRELLGVRIMRPEAALDRIAEASR